MAATAIGDIELVVACLSNGADPSAQDHDGNTALMIAVARHNDALALSLAELLLQRGADPRTTKVDGWNAVMFARARKKPKCAALLARLCGNQ